MLAITASAHSGFSPHLIDAAAVLRLSAAQLARFLARHPALRAAAPAPSPTEAAGATNTEYATDIRALLRATLMHTPQPPNTRDLLHWLIECVEDDGFLSLPDAPADLPAPAAVMDAAIARLQSIAPAGVAARNAQERVLLQLAQTPPLPVRAIAQKFVRHHWEALRRKRWDKLPARGRDAALSLLQSLPAPELPAPAAAPALPDVVFVKQRGLWRAQPGAGAAPSAALQQTNSASEARVARRVLAAVRARRKWVLAAAQLAADRQSAFFEHGIAALRPLPHAAAAAELRVSPAMLSHILRGKRAIFAGGEFPLKSLFGAHTGSATLQDLLKTLTAQEDPRRPLSDEALRRECRQRGFAAARRTIAKHRACAGIAPAALRKRV